MVPELDAIGFPTVARPPMRPPRVVVRADLLAGLVVVALVGVLGVPLGWIWSQLAPGQRMRVIAADREPVPLPLESWHRFEDLAVFLLLGLAAGVLVGAVMWLLRERRGPVLMLAAIAGSVLAGWLAMRLGVAFGQLRFAVPARPAVGAVLERAPVLESGWGVLAQPLAVALVYGFLAAWNGHDDLGRRLG
jgi:hypothetical protein